MAKKSKTKTNAITADNDNLHKVFDDLVPEEYKDTDQYLDVVQWNIEWFGASKSAPKDKSRRALVKDILKTFNADLFVSRRSRARATTGTKAR